MVDFSMMYKFQQEVDTIYKTLNRGLELFNHSSENLAEIISLKENSNYDVQSILTAKYNFLKNLLDGFNEIEHKTVYIFDFYAQPHIIGTITFSKETGVIQLNHYFEYVGEGHCCFTFKASKN